VRWQPLVCRGRSTLAGAGHPRTQPRSSIAAPARHVWSPCPSRHSRPRRCVGRNWFECCNPTLPRRCRAIPYTPDRAANRRRSLCDGVHRLPGSNSAWVHPRLERHCRNCRRISTRVSATAQTFARVCRKLCEAPPRDTHRSHKWIRLLCSSSCSWYWRWAAVDSSTNVESDSQPLLCGSAALKRELPTREAPF
jgi:hypothetical protein